MSFTSKIYELGSNGKLIEMDKTANNNLPIGTLLQWEGYSYDKEVITGKTVSAFDGTVIYTTIKLSNCSYRRQEAYTLKPITDKKDHRIAVYILPETLPADEILTLVQKADALKNASDLKEAAHKAERDTAIEKGRKIAAEKIPADCVSLIVAEYDCDKSDSQSDYFAHNTTQLMILATSKNKRDNFAEMRKAAATFPPTKHMGPGHDIFKPRVVFDLTDVPGKSAALQNNGFANDGSISRWHEEMFRNEKGNEVEFTTKAEAEAWIALKGLPGPVNDGTTAFKFRWQIYEESFEHRDKYSGGSGYYLKDGWTNATGWRVRKCGKWAEKWGDEIYLSLGRNCIL